MTTILDTLILFAVNPVGFVMLASLLIFFEYLIVKNLIKDTSIASLKIVFKYIKNYKTNIIFLIFSRPKPLVKR